MRTLSWVLLAVVATLTLLGSLASAYVAYGGARDEFGPGGPTLTDVAAWRAEVATAIRARRATAASYAAGYAVLLLLTVLGPYRRGEVWSWWAILWATLVASTLSLARVPLLGTRLGAGTAIVQLGVVLLALLLDVGRLKAPPTVR